MRLGWKESRFVPVMTALIGAAWLTLWLWEYSPYGRYLDHGRWTEIGLAASVCRVLPAGDVLLPALLYVGGRVVGSDDAADHPAAARSVQADDRAARGSTDAGCAVGRRLLAGVALLRCCGASSRCGAAWCGAVLRVAAV